MISDALTIFVHGRKIGEIGALFIKLTANETLAAATGSTTRKKRASGNGYSSGAAVYSPRVWNETAKAWMPSSEVEVLSCLTGTTKQ